MSKPFKLSSALYGHSLDVRSVAVTCNNCIVSGSRDKTAKFWAPNGFNVGYSESLTYRDQKHFVSTVLYLEPTKEFPGGAVITGGNDNLILVYNQHEPFATFTFKEHTNAVCSLSKGLEQGTFLSSSWDGSAKFWNLSNPSGSLTTYIGHTAAVWSVIQLQNGNVVTASADKTIGIFSKDGHRLNTLQGHTDCVRNLADFPEFNFFISVSNDASIKVWTYGGENTQTYYGHTNYIYSVARNKAHGENCFVTSDEDRTVRYWKNGSNTETIRLPAQSVWSVACLSNGDIVTGCSDGVIRIFTQEESRFASETALKKYEEEVNALVQQSMQEIGGVKVSDLPGKEALYEPGKKAGQMKMIREPQGVVAYTWVEEGESSHWEKVGDVLSGNDTKTEGKTMYEGQAYDFVFSVDVEDGKPPLKLPYNKGEDPYTAAHNFLQKNMLPADYLDQVVDFIHTNSKDGTAVTTNSEYVDPFTGATRYTPQSNTNAQQTGNSAMNLDPFTGESSYTSKQLNQSNVRKSEYFPLNVYRTFDNGDPKLILGKLKEFNAKAGDQKVSDEILERIVGSCLAPAIDPQDLDNLFKLLWWPDDLLFPVLDVVRLSLKHETNNKLICLKNDGEILEKLKYCISQDCLTPNVTVVAFRAICNCFVFTFGEELVYRNRVDLLENITSLSTTNKNIQVGLSTCLLNMIILSLRKQDEIGLELLASVVPDIIVRLEDLEAKFRALVGVGTLITSCADKDRALMQRKIVENKSFVEALRSASNSQDSGLGMKVRTCAALVLNEVSPFL